MNDIDVFAGFARRTTNDPPGTRGPHLNLFSGGLPKAQKAEAKPPTIAEQVAEFEKARKLNPETAAVLRVVLEAFDPSQMPVTLDGFEIAKRAKLSYEATNAARTQLLNLNVLRTRADNVFGIDGLVPGDAWEKRKAGGRR